MEGRDIDVHAPPLMDAEMGGPNVVHIPDVDVHDNDVVIVEDNGAALINEDTVIEPDDQSRKRRWDADHDQEELQAEFDSRGEMYVTRPEGSASSSTRVHPTTTATSDPYQADLHALEFIETLAAFGVDGNGMEKILLELNSVVRQMCAMGVDVFEMYSPPRVVALAKRYGLREGFSLDLTTQDENGNPWDYGDPEQRAKAKALVLEAKPWLLIGSPPCTFYSILSNWNHGKWIRRSISAS